MKNGLFRTGRLLLVLLFFYAVIGFFIVPGVALHVVNQQLAQHAQVPAKLKRLDFNPFTLTLTLHDYLQADASGIAQVRFETLSSDLRLDSLWRRELHLGHLTLDNAHVEIRRDEQGQLNLAHLFALPAGDTHTEAQSTEEASAASPLAFHIDRIQVSGLGLAFEDTHNPTPVRVSYNSIDLAATDLGSRPDQQATLQLSARGPDGADLDWQAELGLFPLRSSGTLQLGHTELRHIWPYLHDLTSLTLESGAVAISSGYQLEQGSSFMLRLQDSRFGLQDLVLKAKQQPLLELQNLNLENGGLDLLNRQVSLGNITSQGLKVRASRLPDGSLDWQAFIKVPASSESASNEPPWQILMTRTVLRNYQAHLLDRQPEQDVALDIGPLNLELGALDTASNKAVSLKLDSGIGQRGRLSAQGSLNPSDLSASLHLGLEEIDMRIAQAYISPFVRLELRSGLLSSQLQVDLASVAPLDFTVAGATQVTQFHSLDTLQSRDLVRWQSLQLQKLRYQHQKSLSVEAIKLNQPYVRFLLNEDMSTNFDKLVVPQPATASPSSASTPLAIHIGGIDIANGSANFADFSLRPPFATAIQELNGHVGALDSQSRSTASVDIKGRIDRYAPVSIKGQLTPFDPLEKLDIATSFHQVELTKLTPYSGKFAGYRIRRGRMDLDLHYRIESGKLNAENRVVLDKLQLGERVDSPDAVDLPIKLAIALLKDADGKIDISLPVQGDLNDPQFSLTPIIWKTLRNLLVRAAQAPFKFIGGLVSGAQDIDLSQVPFAPGSATLPSQAQPILDTLAKALLERPSLRLEIEGTAQAAQDGAFLAHTRLEQEYQALYYQMLQRRGEKVPAKAEQLDVPDSVKPALLEAIYRNQLKSQPPQSWKELQADARQTALQQALIERWTSQKSLLRRLAQQRADAIKAYLVDSGKLQEDRLYLLDAQLLESADGPLIMSNLHLDSQ